MTKCCDNNSACTTTSQATTAEVASASTPQTVVRYRIDAMDCPTEEALIRNKLSTLFGVVSLDFNLLERRLAVHHTLPVTEPIEAALTAIGMKGEPILSHTRTRFRIPQMDCPTEERLIQDKLAPLPEVEALEFNVSHRTLTVTHAVGAENTVLEALRTLDFSPEIENEATQTRFATPSAHRKAHAWFLALSGIAAVAAELVEFSGWGGRWLVGALALLAIASGGLSTYKKGWIALKNRNLNINALMSIAVTGAMLIGQWPEAAMVMFLFAQAEVIEAKSIDRARNAIRGLMDLTPTLATVQQPDGQWKDIDANTVPVGAIVRVRPGERIGLDGEVLVGRSTINQAPITGESLPVEKGPGDTVFAGTINEAGSLEYRVTAAAQDTTLARIIHAVEEAQGARAPTQRFVDQFAKIYTPVIFAFALAVAVIPPLLWGGLWFDWVYRALVLLVVACPCALVISTPVTIVSGLAAAARQGILIKGGVYLENGRHLQTLALDKTGTLTQGKPEQTDVRLMGDGDPAIYQEIALSLASRSDHPVSQALVRAAPSSVSQQVMAFAALPGRGVEGQLNGMLYRLGNHRLIEDLGLCSSALEQQLESLERQGKTVVLLADETRVLALFAVADTIKVTSRDAITQLHALGVTTLMLTGDNAHTADVIGKQVGIDEIKGNQLPEDKLKTITALIESGRIVGMVGDGINDAPALARANIGFAMGAAGTDTAIETADVALMDDDLRKIPSFVRLSRHTAAVLKQNIALALGIKIVFLVLTLAGTATMWMAVFADMGASLLVVANGLRLLNHFPAQKE